MNLPPRITVPRGLPDRLAGQTGFDRLCTILGIETTARKQSVVGSGAVRSALKQLGPPPRGLRRASRLKWSLVTYYSSPRHRLKIWQLHADSEFDSSTLIPSLEASIIRNYDNDLFAAEIDDATLVDCQKLFDNKEKLEPWKVPAVAALPTIRSDILNWRELEPEQREIVALAAFAVATILDDSRLLFWSAEKVDHLATEFSSLIDDSFTSTVDEPESEQPPDVPARRENVAQTFRNACKDLAEIALKLRYDPLDRQLFQDLSRRYNEIRDLRERAVSELVANQIANLLTEVKETILSQATNVPWLAGEADKILVSWTEKYPIDNPDLETLSTDVERVKHDLPGAINAWHSAIRTTQTMVRDLRDVEVAGDLAAQIRANRRVEELSTAIAAAKRREINAIRHALQLASPYGQGRVITSFAQSEEESLSNKNAESTEDDNDVDTPDEHGAPIHHQPDPSLTKPDTVSSSDVHEALVQETTATDATTTSTATDSRPEHVAGYDITRNDNRIADTQSCLSEKPTIPQPEIEESLDPSFSALAHPVWQAIAHHLPGIAYHIVRLTPLEQRDPTFPPANLVAASAVANSINAPNDKIVETLTDYLTEIHSDDMKRDNEHIRDALHLLLLSATLRPALFAPSTGGLTKLRHLELSSAFSSVYELAEVVANHAESLQAISLDVTRVRGALSNTAWKYRVDQHLEGVKQWLRNAGSQRILHRPTQRVWKHWQRKDSVLGELVDLLLEIDEANKDRVQAIQEKLEDQQEFVTLVNYTDRIQLGRKTGKNIEGRALTQLRKHTVPILEFLQNWGRLLAAKPDPNNYIDRAIVSLRRALHVHGPVAISALKDFELQQPVLPVAAAIKMARNSIEDFLALFDSTDDTNFTQRQPQPVNIDHDLVFVVDVDIDGDYRLVDGQDPELCLGYLAHTALCPPTLAEAFHGRSGRGDLIGARLACDRMDAVGDSDSDRCRIDLGNIIQEKRRQLRARQTKVSGDIEQSYCLGQLTPDERDRLAAQCVATHVSTPKADAVTLAIKDLRAIEKCLRNYREKSTATLSNSIRELKGKVTPEEMSLVRKAQDSHDLVTVREYVERLKNGNPIMAAGSSEPDSFADFLNVLPEINNALEEPNRPTHGAIITAVKRQESVAGINFGAMTEHEASHASQLLEAWYEIARYHQFDKRRLQDLFSLLGFDVKSVTPGDNRIAVVHTEPIQDRTLCPIHLFGSAANGQYRVLLNWRTPARESLVQAIGSLRGQLMVLHFGPLGDDREFLRNWSLQNQRLFLAIDEALVLFLAARPNRRLKTLFDSTLPYTAADPFVTTSSLVPPEMFYGRTHEREEVMNQYGGCFVYGGRQLGKTALLRSAEAVFHNPKAKHIAKWIDLKVREIGYARQTEEIWSVLWKELTEVGIIPEMKSQPKGTRSLVSTLERVIRKWLTDNKDSRILLLLDEADAFLEADAHSDFLESIRLKGIMDETERRFKVVFSGLHNVLRTTERANHPLAHFGDPICIGPLLHNGEWQSARSLVREPLAAVGFGFEHDNVVTRILARTNYYPSLIQLYGAELVRYLRDSTRAAPYRVGGEDINAVFMRDGLRNYIRARFLLTLQLDPRYEVIAYSMALDLRENTDNLANGLSPERIAEQARSWWPDGFDIPDIEFDTLLHEMAGLGVLRRTVLESPEVQRYTFRNPNVLLLLGTANDIEKALYKPRELPKIFEASSFHARYVDDDVSPKRGPLTYEQEARLRNSSGVAILAGTQAANIGHVSKFLSGRIGPSNFRELEPCYDKNRLERQITSLRPDRRQGLHVYMVPLGTPWSALWIEKAATALRRVQRRNLIRVVFIAEPQNLWSVLTDIDENASITHLKSDVRNLKSDTRQTRRQIDWIDLGPWDISFLRRWCDDHDLHVDQGVIDALMEMSGGWPKILEKYDRSPHRHSRNRLAALEQFISRHRSDLLSQLGIDTPQVQYELETLFSYETFTSNQVIQLVRMQRESGEETLSILSLRRRLIWARHLGILQNRNGVWQVNPLVQRMLVKES